MENVKPIEDAMIETVKKLAYAKNAVNELLLSSNASVDMHDIVYWAGEVQRLRERLVSLM